MSVPPRLLSYGTALLVFVLDRITKAVIDARVSAQDIIVVIPSFFNIVHTKNRGVAFGLFGGNESEWRSFLLIGLSLAVLTLVSILLWQPSGGRESWMMRIGLALILGGALGNVYDRITSGMVTDFLEFYLGDYHWPAFNVADSAITVGAGLLLLDMWWSRHAPGPAARRTGGTSAAA